MLYLVMIGTVVLVAGIALIEQVRPSLALVSNADGEGRTPLAELAMRRGVPTVHTGSRGDIELRAGDPTELRTQFPSALPVPPEGWITSQPIQTR